MMSALENEDMLKSAIIYWVTAGRREDAIGNCSMGEVCRRTARSLELEVTTGRVHCSSRHNTERI